MAGEKKVTVKLLVDKEKSRVVFAESDKDFVDILFSFLTLPLGAIVRSLGKRSSLGCLDGLYQSVEHLDAQYLQTEACKTMLLHPISAAALRCEHLVLNVDDTKPRKFYTCYSGICDQTTRFYSSVPKARCHCGQTMAYAREWDKTEEFSVGETSQDGVFVKGGLRYIISDDLHVMAPASTAVLISLIDKLGINDATMLDERNLVLGVEEVRTLLRKSLISKTPLTYLYFHKLNGAAGEADDKDLLVQPKDERNADTESTKEIKVRLLLAGTYKLVVSLEVEKDFVELLFSFLTFPLASVVKLLHGHSCIGSIDNLYKSAEDLGKLGNAYIKSEECRKILLSPELASFFGSSQNMLKINERLSDLKTVKRCYECFSTQKYICTHRVGRAFSIQLTEVNPKSPVGGTETGGGYVKGPGKFLVMDGLRVAPISLVSTVQILNEMKVPINSLVEREVEFGEAQALNLLKAALLSHDAIRAVFSPNKMQKRRTYLG